MSTETYDLMHVRRRSHVRIYEAMAVNRILWTLSIVHLRIKPFDDDLKISLDFLDLILSFTYLRAAKSQHRTRACSRTISQHRLVEVDASLRDRIT
jgi:hypothetical protein